MKKRLIWLYMILAALNEPHPTFCDLLNPGTFYGQSCADDVPAHDFEDSPLLGPTVPPSLLRNHRVFSLASTYISEFHLNNALMLADVYRQRP
jgi:hypothetical protein